MQGAKRLISETEELAPEDILAAALEQEDGSVLRFALELLLGKLAAEELRLYSGERLVASAATAAAQLAPPPLAIELKVGQPGVWTRTQDREGWAVTLRLFHESEVTLLAVRFRSKFERMQRIAVSAERVASLLTTALLLDKLRVPDPTRHDARKPSIFEGVIAQDPVMLRVLREAARFASSDVPVHIEGESGTGKEVLARAIHLASPRRDCPFVGENCGAIPEKLLESEFFGVVRGAFTGAERSAPGLIERSDQGSLFLDEIGEMPVHQQKKILRVLQERRVRRLGSTCDQAVDFRLISATNRSLDQLVTEKRFREDLFYRIRVASLRLPPLRERRDDIPVLVDHFNLQFASQLERAPLAFDAEAFDRLIEFHWPGNVRQLHNEIWRLHATSRGRVRARHISRGIRASRSPKTSSQGLRLIDIEARVVGEAIRDAIARSGGNIAAAARELGVPRATLYRRMDRYGIPRPR